MMQLRDYQIAAVQSVFDWFAQGKEHPLIVLPTGTGKSVVIAELSKQIIEDYSRARIIVATHVKELVEQNADKMRTIWPRADIGIFSAGLGRKDFNRQITFAGIQSIYKHGLSLPKIDVLIIDEAHTLPHGSYGRWHKFISDLKVANPNVQVIGLTATPFRLETGHLCEGDDALFTGISYDYSILDAVKNGYICEIVPRPVQTRYNLKGVHTLGGEFKSDELERAVDTDAENKSAVNEIIEFGQERGSWLVFCAGNSHAAHINDELVARGINSRVITQDTARDDRDEWLAQFKRGEIRCIVNNMILTTGFDAPGIDLIACLRPTKSAGLWVQICGRGMRLANGKEDCLMLDFGRNSDRHGELDRIKPKKTKGSGDGDAPIKICGNCHAVVFAGCRTCPDCGHEFPPPELQIAQKASSKALLSTQIKPEWFHIDDIRYSRNIGRDGKPDTMRVSYYCGLTDVISEFICLDHPADTYPYQKAIKWLKDRGYNPNGEVMNLDNVLCRTAELAWPSKIQAKKDGKYWQIIGFEF